MSARLIERAELAVAAAQSAVDELLRCGPSKRFPEAEHRRAIERAMAMVVTAKRQQFALLKRLEETPF